MSLDKKKRKSSMLCMNALMIMVIVTNISMLIQNDTVSKLRRRIISLENDKAERDTQKMIQDWLRECRRVNYETPQCKKLRPEAADEAAAE